MAAIAAGACTRGTAGGNTPVVRRYATSEATQAVAAGGDFIYAIGNAEMGKYDKRTGERVGAWRERPGGRIAHLNSGRIVGDELYCAHSNYPHTPMVSSIEVFDAMRLAHVRSLPLPSGLGSATWVERTDGDWWVAFAHYAGRGGEPGKGPEHTRLVRFDSGWRQKDAWAFPAAVVARWDRMSSSGGAWTGGRRFYTTGHHAPEWHVLELPESGTELVLHAIVPTEGEGQGIAFDPADGLLYSIQRRTREVLASKLPM
jgi:hypothetical protein